MKSVYACLAGNWVNLNDDPECKMDTSRSSPAIWEEEQLKDLFKFDHIKIEYKGIGYRIHPSFIQIVTR